MTKAEIVSNISEKLGMEKNDVQAMLETFMTEVKDSLESGENVYLRGFGSFIVKKRAAKTGRNISKNTRSEEHTSELQSRGHLVCRLLLEKKKRKQKSLSA